MKQTFAADDALGNPVPLQEHEIVASFPCADKNYVYGCFVKGEHPGEVIPLYLTQAHLDELIKSRKGDKS